MVEEMHRDGIIFGNNKNKSKVMKSLAMLIVVCFALLSTSCGKQEVDSTNVSLYEGDEILTAMVDKAKEVNIYEDYKDEEYQKVTLNGDSIEFDGNGAEVNGSDILVKAAGTYVLTGTLNDGAVIVETDEEENVVLVLENAHITCKDGAPLYIKECGKNVVVSLPEGTENSLTDGEKYSYEYALEKTDEETGEVSIQPEATVFSKADLRINGTGSLTINSKASAGIVSKDDLEIAEATVVVNAADSGIVGKDCVAVRSGDISITAGGDGIKASNDEEAEKGYISIADGIFNITSEEDGMQAESVLITLGGEFNIKTGTGYQERLALEQAVIDAENSMMGGGFGGGQRPEKMQNGQIPEGMEKPEGMKRPEDMSEEELEKFMTEMKDKMPEGAQRPERPEGMQRPNDANAEKTNTALAEAEAALEADDTSRKALKANGKVLIQDGVFSINAADDGIKADEYVAIASGDITIQSGGDGIQSENKADIFGGDIVVTISVEGLEGKEIVIYDGNLDLTAIDDGLNISGDELETDTESSFTLNIKGGKLLINAEGDGIDINGSGYMSGGEVVVNGPTLGMNAALDYDKVFEVTGGNFVAIGPMGMAQTPSENSTVYTVTTAVGNQKAGTEITLVDSEGNTIFSITPEKDFAHIVVSCEEIIKGGEYKIMAGENEVASFTSEEVITNLSGGFGPMGGGFGDGQKPEMTEQNN